MDWSFHVLTQATKESFRIVKLVAIFWLCIPHMIKTRRRQFSIHYMYCFFLKGGLAERSWSDHNCDAVLFGWIGYLRCVFRLRFKCARKDHQQWSGIISGSKWSRRVFTQAQFRNLVLIPTNMKIPTAATVKLLTSDRSEAEPSDKHDFIATKSASYETTFHPKQTTTVVYIKAPFLPKRSQRP